MMGAMGLLSSIWDLVSDLFEDAVDGIGEGDATKPPRQPAGPQQPSARVGSNAKPGFDWEKFSTIFTPEWIEAVHRETGISQLKISFGLSQHMSSVMQPWIQSGRTPSDQEWENIREIMKNRIAKK